MGFLKSNFVNESWGHCSSAVEQMRQILFPFVFCTQFQLVAAKSQFAPAAVVTAVTVEAQTQVGGENELLDRRITEELLIMLI